MWRFLPSEMMVMLGLAEDATRTDAEVGELFGMNKATVASVRRRLLDAGAIHFANIPSFGRLGCELMAFHMGTTDPAVPSETKANDYMEFCDRSPRVFNAFIGGGSITFFTVFRNATELSAFLLEHNKFFSGTKRASKAKLETAVFPYAHSRGIYTTNFAPTVHRYFQLDVPPPKARPPTIEPVVEPDLTENEKKVLLGLVAHPEATDRELASGVRLSRQAVTRIRNKLYGDGLLTKVCIPRLYKWGFEMLAVTHSRFTMDLRWDIRLKSQPKDITEQSFFMLSKADEAVSNHMISGYHEYSGRMEDLLGWYHKMKVFDGNPSINVFPLERSTELRSFDFAPAVGSLLERRQACRAPSENL